MIKKQRILGIDPGSRLTGFGIVDFDGDKVKYVSSGTIQSIDGGFVNRLKEIFKSINKITKTYSPDIVVVESVFMHKNPSSALKLGHARSAAICATFSNNVEIYEYTPREIKKAITGSGAATKDQVQHMIINILNLDGAPAIDASDALAVAICHGHQSRIQGYLGISKPLTGSV